MPDDAEFKVFAPHAIAGTKGAEIIPELFLLQRDQLFVRDAEVRQVPEAGITLALPAEAAA